jgi:hypothetical protein
VAETKAQKAERYLLEARITVLRAGGGQPHIMACARGDSGAVYDLGYDANAKEWRCTCEANAKFHRECSHLIALKRVTVKPKEDA